MIQDQGSAAVVSPEKGILNLPGQTRKIIFSALAVLCLTPYISAPVALLLGLLTAQLIANPFKRSFSEYKITARLLQYSVVGLGFSMNIGSAVAAGKQDMLFTVCSISGTLVLGAALGVLMKIDKKTAHLISSGTAICGGSAIAAIAPVIRAEEKQISVALGIVFMLNSVALFVFPVIGHYLQLSQTQFGLWCAIAIHDTSSVVGAASAYGEEALKLATTVKLARALWIIPLALLTTIFFKEGKQKIKIPYFIGFFILAMVLNTYVPGIGSVSPYLVKIARAGLVLTLFFIGAGLSMQIIRSVSFKPLVQGIILWICIASASLTFIIYHIN
jgi:uncharacterized integral membrane protein (TIGR00698 family)